MPREDLAVGQEDMGLEEDAPSPRDPQAIATRDNSSAVEANYRAAGATNDTKKTLAAFLARSDGDLWKEDVLPAKALQFMTYTVSIEDTCRLYWTRNPGLTSMHIGRAICAHGLFYFCQNCGSW